MMVVFTHFGKFICVFPEKSEDHPDFVLYFELRFDIIFVYIGVLWGSSRGGLEMFTKLSRTNLKSPKLYLICMALFMVCTLLAGEYYLAAGEGVVFVVLLIYSAIVSRNSQKELMKMLESVTYSADSARTNTLTNFPLPMAVFRIKDGKVIWANQMFFDACAYSGFKYDKSISEYVPGFKGKWLLERKTQYPGLLELNGRRYRVHGNIAHTDKDEQNGDYMGITYWVDVTEYDKIREEFELSKPVVAVIVVDNYEELMKNQSDRTRGELRQAMEERILHWGGEKDGIIQRFDKDRYLLIFEERYMPALIEDKFSVLESLHEVVNPAGIHASISLGLGRDGSGLEENYSFANLGLDMALSRGGDQAVIKNHFNFEFYGGKGSALESRTKVKSRVMANALQKLIVDSSMVLVMGHKFADMDAVGAAVGVCCAARCKNIRASIVLDRNECPAMPLVEKLETEDAFKGLFITEREAMIRADSRTLLVVVDTNRPDQVQSESLLQTCNRIAVIDHHRRSASYIDNAILTILEPSASSASELLGDILQEIAPIESITKLEAEAMLAGIVLDTKNFNIRTGERTFETAAFLRRVGADTTVVKRLLQNNMESNVQKYSIMQYAKNYRGVIIAAPDTPQDRIVAAQAADELLNIAGAEASVVIYPTKEGSVFASARSIGEVNVQLIMEKLGGGGNRAAAAAQMEDIEFNAAVANLKKAIDEYLDE